MADFFAQFTVSDRERRLAYFPEIEERPELFLFTDDKVNVPWRPGPLESLTLDLFGIPP